MINDTSSSLKKSLALQSSNPIHPIPIIRRSLPNSSELRTRLKVYGYKNFSKISAAGPDTLQVLKDLKKSASLKMTSKFEFDPYLSDFPCLSELSLVLKKLKNIKHLILIIRRVEENKDHSFNEVCSNIYKLLRLTKVKV